MRPASESITLQCNGEEAVGGGSISLHNLCNPAEITGLHILRIHLKIHVESVRHFRRLIQFGARTPVVERRAVSSGAGVVHAARHLVFVAAHVHAPFLLHVLHVLRPHRHLRVPFSGDVHRELRLPVVPARTSIYNFIFFGF